MSTTKTLTYKAAIGLALVALSTTQPAEAKRFFRGSIAHWVEKKVNPTVTPILRTAVVAAGASAGGALGGVGGKVVGACAGKYVNARFAGKRSTNCSKAGLL